jgi:hypothetical protein
MENCATLPWVHPSTESTCFNKWKRFIRLPKIRSDDFLWTFSGSFYKFNKPLILIHQNIRGLISQTDEIIVSLNLDRISPQVLCISEHHMSENNLNLVNIENYALGSCFCRWRYQKGGVCIFLRNDTCFSHVDLWNCCVEKHFGNMCCQNWI